MDTKNFQAKDTIIQESTRGIERDGEPTPSMHEVQEAIKVNNIRAPGIDEIPA